ncbi:MAG: GH92 family glycosyl hydrolase [Ginsengibacter sp.]
MMKTFSFVALLLLLTVQTIAQDDLTKYVNPFVGTGGHGHTYPGAVLPHGMVQLSPDTRLEGWDGCSGYHYSDSFLYGFTHTHLSGTGISDYGDILLMPMAGKPSPDNKIYGSFFSHANEKASPGYYSVLLDDDHILAELTATTRAGMHRYTFPTPGQATIILDLKHRDEVLESSIAIEDSITVSGMRRSRAWAQNQYVFFVIKFSRPFLKYGIYKNDTIQDIANSSFKDQKNLKAFFQFDAAGKQVLSKVAISQVSIEGAKKNLDAEIPGWNFDKVRNAAAQSWNHELGKIDIKGGSVPNRTTFYTALYHTMVVPNIASDVDGQYRGRDNKIHTAAGFTYYTVFSLWDTYRAANPLYTIIDKKRTLDYIKTFLTEYQQGGRLPMWELSSNETDCMIGYHSIPVIVDAYMKGINNFDGAFALEAMKKSATWNHYGIPVYMTQGFLEAGDEPESVSRTLEYAFDDWCIAQFARSLGKNSDYREYIKRSQYYKNILDPSTGFMRPRKNGDWLSSFDPKEVSSNFTEANSWQYSFYVPQDISGYTAQLGGRKKLEDHLDNLFAESSQTTGNEQNDISGLIGQYAHGNEPSHHIIYLYNFAGTPWKAQEKVHQVIKEMYQDAPDGLAGNEDCGQMSAWYVLSALGFYEVTPASNKYIIGTPLFPEATIHLENGKQFSIKAKNVDDKNFYIQSAAINGKAYTKSFFDHKEIAGGGSLLFIMGPVASSFGTKNLPSTSIKNDQLIPNPVIGGGNEISYSGNKTIHITDNQSGSAIFYTMNGEDPKPGSSIKYTAPLEISNSVVIKAIAADADGNVSKVTTAKYHYKVNNYSVISSSKYEQHYQGGSANALVDEEEGTANWRKGNWQGYQGNDVDVVIDLGKLKTITNVTAGFLQDSRSWILMPKELTIETSVDGQNFEQVYQGENFLPIEDVKVQRVQVTGNFNATQAHYVRLKATQYGRLPAWHEGAGGDSHIFIDEISIN